MPRFFFDIHDNFVSHDDVGRELPDRAAARTEALNALPQIAADEIPTDSDRRHFTVLVTDEDRRAVYAATLTYTGLWLMR